MRRINLTSGLNNDTKCLVTRESLTRGHCCSVYEGTLSTLPPLLLLPGTAERFLRQPYRAIVQGPEMEQNLLEGTFEQRNAAYCPVPFANRCRIEWVGDPRKIHFYQAETLVEDSTDTTVVPGRLWAGGPLCSWQPGDMDSRIRLLIPVQEDGRHSIDLGLAPDHGGRTPAKARLQLEISRDPG